MQNDGVYLKKAGEKRRKTAKNAKNAQKRHVTTRHISKFGLQNTSA